MSDLKHLKKDSGPYGDSYDPDLLDTFLNPRQGRMYTIRFETAEVTSLCPVTGQPDFYRVAIEYVPDRDCLESKSLKLYLFSLRGTGLFAEDMANRLLDDLVRTVSPHWMKVVCSMNPRGGVSLTVTAEEGEPLSSSGAPPP